MNNKQNEDLKKNDLHLCGLDSQITPLSHKEIEMTSNSDIHNSIKNDLVEGACSTKIEMASNTVLHNAISDGDIQKIENILEKDIIDVNSKNELGETPFYLAAGSPKGIYFPKNNLTIYHKVKK